MTRYLNQVMGRTEEEESKRVLSELNGRMGALEGRLGGLEQGISEILRAMRGGGT